MRVTRDSINPWARWAIISQKSTADTMQYIIVAALISQCTRGSIRRDCLSCNVVPMHMMCEVFVIKCM